MNGLKTLLVAGSLAFASSQAFALAITPSNSGIALANSIAGSGVTIEPGTVNYVGADGQAGLFSQGGVIGIGSGILLTTGLAENALGPNEFFDLSTDVEMMGDSQMDTLAEIETFDANVLEFDFTSNGGTLSLDYVFASEDYPDSINTFLADYFAVFLDGINIATIGGEPISANSVNCGRINPDVPPSNCDVFNDNNAPPFLDIEYDGFTDVLTASVLGLSAGTHSLKLAIADSGDHIFDSGAFIRAGSLSVSSTPPVEVPEPATFGLLVAGVAGMALRRRRH
ncbi:choice-of-anchor L family PEP-CTERM protein [Marinobacter fonticola]|uniref:choice-of-anchor L family PEP-CTERM protein n=1 Tax=Marinobacter fonticola TaxID=2603215 RepID=UPI0011E6544E|nr:choice-of-anchor L domain-containing protein [Marinobacter fonticola]